MPVGKLDFSLLAAQIHSFEVQKSHQNMGVGTKLMKYFLDEMRSRRTQWFFCQKEDGQRLFKPGPYDELGIYLHHRPSGILLGSINGHVDSDRVSKFPEPVDFMNQSKSSLVKLSWDSNESAFFAGV